MFEGNRYIGMYTALVQDARGSIKAHENYNLYMEHCIDTGCKGLN